MLNFLRPSLSFSVFKVFECFKKLLKFALGSNIFNFRTVTCYCFCLVLCLRLLRGDGHRPQNLPCDGGADPGRLRRRGNKVTQGGKTMEKLRLIPVTEAAAEAVEGYRAAFPEDRERVTYDPRRIPGLDGLEAFPDAAAWIRYTREMAGPEVSS